jgi:hypothetical protein
VATSCSIETTFPYSAIRFSTCSSAQSCQLNDELISSSEIQYTSFGEKRSLKLSITNCALVIKYVHRKSTVKINPRIFNSLKIFENL